MTKIVNITSILSEKKYKEEHKAFVELDRELTVLQILAMLSRALGLLESPTVKDSSVHIQNAELHMANAMLAICDELKI